MLMRVAPVIAVTALVLLATGCTTAPDNDLSGKYQPPSASGAEVAFLSGSRVGGGMLDEDHRAYILLVDNLFLPEARNNWQKPVSITAGEHIVTAAYAYGSFVARTELKLQAKAQATYHLMFKYGTEGPRRQLYNDFWIVDDADGKTVTPVQHSVVTGGSTYSPFEVN